METLVHSPPVGNHFRIDKQLLIHWESLQTVVKQTPLLNNNKSAWIKILYKFHDFPGMHHKRRCPGKLDMFLLVWCAACDYLSDRLISVGYGLFGMEREVSCSWNSWCDTWEQSKIMLQLPIKLTARCTCGYDNLSGNVIYGGQLFMLLGSWGSHRQSCNVGSKLITTYDGVLPCRISRGNRNVGGSSWLHNGVGCCWKPRQPQSLYRYQWCVYDSLVYCLVPRQSLPLIASIVPYKEQIKAWKDFISPIMCHISCNMAGRVDTCRKV